MEANKYTYDFFVIGGGSGGLAASKEAAKFGAKVGLADNQLQKEPNGV